MDAESCRDRERRRSRDLIRRVVESRWICARSPARHRRRQCRTSRALPTPKQRLTTHDDDLRPHASPPVAASARTLPEALPPNNRVGSTRHSAGTALRPPSCARARPDRLPEADRRTSSVRSSPSSSITGASCEALSRSKSSTNCRPSGLTDRRVARRSSVEVSRITSPSSSSRSRFLLLAAGETPRHRANSPTWSSALPAMSLRKQNWDRAQAVRTELVEEGRLEELTKQRTQDVAVAQETVELRAGRRRVGDGAGLSGATIGGRHGSPAFSSPCQYLTWLTIYVVK